VGIDERKLAEREGFGRNVASIPALQESLFVVSVIVLCASQEPRAY
jgi:hypothetical protein